MKTISDFKNDFKALSDHAESMDNVDHAVKFLLSSVDIIIQSEYMHIEKDCNDLVSLTARKKLSELGVKTIEDFKIALIFILEKFNKQEILFFKIMELIKSDFKHITEECLLLAYSAVCGVYNNEVKENEND